MFVWVRSMLKPAEASRSVVTPFFRWRDSLMGLRATVETCPPKSL